MSKLLLSLLLVASSQQFVGSDARRSPSPEPERLVCPFDCPLDLQLGLPLDCPTTPPTPSPDKK